MFSRKLGIDLGTVNVTIAEREQILLHEQAVVAITVEEERIVGLDLRDKKPNLAAMQLADLVITPIGRRAARKPPKTDQVQWSVVKGKLRRHNGKIKGAGLVIRP